MIAAGVRGNPNAMRLRRSPTTFLAVSGGRLFRVRSIPAACTNLLIITEGFSTYGGLSGRDMEAIAIGLVEIFDEHYLEYRIKSTTFLGDHLHSLGVPLMLRGKSGVQLTRAGLAAFLCDGRHGLRAKVFLQVADYHLRTLASIQSSLGGAKPARTTGNQGDLSHQTVSQNALSQIRESLD